MRILWQEKAWEEYLRWQFEDKKTLKRINRLLVDIARNGYSSTGKPEPLRGDFAGFWSVRIDEKTVSCFAFAMKILKFGSAAHIITANNGGL